MIKTGFLHDKSFCGRTIFRAEVLFQTLEPLKMREGEELPSSLFCWSSFYIRAAMNICDMDLCEKR